MTDRKKNVSTSGMIPAGFLWRFVAALALVLTTFNPSGHSAYHWVTAAIGISDFGPLHLLLVGVLLAGWAIFWVSTWRSLGPFGFTLAGVILGAIIWFLFDIGLLESHSVSAITWIALIALAAVLAVGVAWSHLWRRMTGQFNVEDVDD